MRLVRYVVYHDTAEEAAEKPYVLVRYMAEGGWGPTADDPPTQQSRLTVIGQHASYGIADYWCHQLNTLQKSEGQAKKALETGLVG
jgi:hypothetical protein